MSIVWVIVSKLEFLVGGFGPKILKLRCDDIRYKSDIFIERNQCREDKD